MPEIVQLSPVAVTIRSEVWGHRAYSNSPTGRAFLDQENPSEIVTEVLAVWGDTPTVEDPEPNLLLDDPQPDPNERIAELEQRVADLTAAVERGMSL